MSLQPKTRLIVVFVILALASGQGRINAASSTIVIGEFRTRGPNGQTDEFIELYNRSGGQVAIGGYQILVSDSTGTTSILTTIDAGTTLAAGCSYLLASTTLPGFGGSATANQHYAVQMSDDGGLAVSTPEGVVLDRVGMSTGTAYKEGTPLAPMSGAADQSYDRKPGGASGHATDTDSNASDFTLATSSPQAAGPSCLGTGGAPQTNPTLSASASPAAVSTGGSILLTVTVVPGTNPASSGVTVNAVLSSIGGPASLALNDSGTNGDVTAGDGRFSRLVTVGIGAGTGAQSLPVLAGDAQGRTAGDAIEFTVLRAAGSSDRDADGLPDAWETQFGLDPNSAIGNDGGVGDPDVDGSANAREYSLGTHPRGHFTRYLAEGATSAFFETSLALVNPATSTATVRLRFLKSDGATVAHDLSIDGRRRVTVAVKDVPGLAAAEFSTVIEADEPVVIDRTMKWNASGYGSHAETSLPSPAATWYLAEGATHSGFNLFYLIQNPNAQAVTVQVTYLLPAPQAPVVRGYSVAARSRSNIWVDAEGDALANTDVSAIITADQPIIVERAMYLDRPGQTFGAGHESAGITNLATAWFLAEGATGGYFDLFVLVANPGETAATIRATFLLPDGTSIVKTYDVGAKSRFNIWVDTEDARLADTAVSTIVTSTNGVPIIVERAMWWPGPTAAQWAEAHNSAGATASASRWVLAEGEVNATSGIETYILIANTSSFAGTARVTLLFEDGTTADQTFPLTANSRFNVAVAAAFPAASGRRFGAVVESLGSSPAQIVVERAMYSDAGGVSWAAGTNALATVSDSTIETATGLVSTAGGQVTLPGGNAVVVPSGTFAADQFVTVASLPGLSLRPANQSLVSAGPAVALTFAPAVSLQDDMTAVVEAAVGEPVSITLTVDPASLAGAVPVVGIEDPQGRHTFAGISATVAGVAATLSVPPALMLDAQRVEVGFVNTRPPDLNLFPAPPPWSPGAQHWNGAAWVAGVSAVQPACRTAVVVHGIESYAARAFGQCADGRWSPEKLQAMGYCQVFGFNYYYPAGVNEGGDKLGVFLESLRLAGLTSADVIGHSMGGTVALRGITKTTLKIDHLATLGSPLMGTPMASAGTWLKGPIDPLATALLNIPAPLNSVEDSLQSVVTWRPFNNKIHGPWVPDMQLGSQTLTQVRQAVIARMADPASNLGTTTLFAAGGGTPILGTQLLSPLFGLKAHDGIVGEASGRGEGAGFDPTRITAAGHHINHVQFTCDDKVLTDLAQVFGLKSPLPIAACQKYCYERNFQETALCTTGTLLQQLACVNAANSRLNACITMCNASLP
jgi:hypothetical protein